MLLYINRTTYISQLYAVNNFTYKLLSSYFVGKYSFTKFGKANAAV